MLRLLVNQTKNLGELHSKIQAINKDYEHMKELVKRAGADMDKFRKSEKMWGRQIEILKSKMQDLEKSMKAVEK